MTRQKFGTRHEKVKRLSAQDIHRMTKETLQTYFQLEREGCEYGPEAIWDVLVAAAAKQTTIETICVELEGPTANTVRNAIKGVLPDDEGIADLEAALNEMLVDPVPKQLWVGKLPCASSVWASPWKSGCRQPHDCGLLIISYLAGLVNPGLSGFSAWRLRAPCI